MKVLLFYRKSSFLDPSALLYQIMIWQPYPYITINLFNLVKTSGTVPRQWTESSITLLYKKGNPDDISNYRPISLLPSMYKLFSSSICYRINAQIDRNQPIEQAGFRKGFSTNDHKQVVEHVIDKY